MKRKPRDALEIAAFEATGDASIDFPEIVPARGIIVRNHCNAEPWEGATWTCVTCGYAETNGLNVVPIGWGILINYSDRPSEELNTQVECPKCVDPKVYAGINHDTLTGWDRP